MGKLEFIALFTTAVSSFVLVILSWMQSNVRLARVEHTLDAAVEKQAADMKAVREEQAANMKAVREELAINMKEVREGLATIHNHLLTFYTVTGRLEGRIDELSRK